jgi:membrane protease YdiL (CAAX protease family)
MVLRRQWQSLLEVALCSGFPTQLVLSGMAMLAGLRPGGEGGGLSLPFVAAVSAADTVLLITLILWFLKLRDESAHQLFFGRRSFGREFVLGLVLVPGVVLFMGGAMWWLRELWPGLRTVPENPFQAIAQSAAGALALLVVAIVAGGIREELQRAFLLHRFRQDLGGPLTGLVVSSAIFGVGHVVQGWDAVLVTAALGAFWATLYFARGSIVAAVVSHGLANGAQVLIAFMQAERLGA